MSHCFISYSNGDADDFGPQLATELEGGTPYIDAWFDKRDILPGQTWDEAVPKAISDCKCLFFVMTNDSVAENSICFEEWDLALHYKKPILVLSLHADAKPPFRLGRRQRIDFSKNRKAGMAKLRLAIQHLDSPEGQLEILRDRIADGERDLVRATDQDKPRIQAEIEELNSQIQVQQKIVDDPKAAEEQTQKNIDAGLERERKPVKEVISNQSTKFINPPPGVSPNYFQDRYFETKQIADFLNNDSQRLLTIVGRAGVGKTAMVCRLLKALERGELPDDFGEMKVDGIVYLSETGSHRVNFANVFADLSKLLPRDDAERLEGIYKNPQTSTGDKMRALLDAFPSGRVILLLDNFETLVDPESLSLRDSELSEALNALLSGQHHAVKAVITTRIAPKDLAMCEPGRQHHLSLDEGLESPYAENVLREMDADGRVGLKSAPDALLNKAREKTRGYPRALEALYAILSVDRYTTLEELLEISLPDEVVQKLVGEAFNRLDPSAQKVMEALAVYNRPVSPAAIDYLLQPHLPSIDSALVLNRLVNMHFARREAGRYYLHPADKEYAFSIIPEKDLTTKDTKVTKEDQEDLTAKNAKPAKEDLNLILESLLSSRASRLTAFTQHDLLNRAADYFAQARKPRAEWKKLDDLSAQLAEFELRCAAGDYDTATSVLIEFDREYLSLWGHYRLMISLHEKVFNFIKDKILLMHILNGLETAYINIGNVKKATSYTEHGLSVAKETKNREAESVFLGNLGGAYAALGDAHKAIQFYEQALVIDREIGNRKSEGGNLNNLGNRYADLGNAPKAIEFQEQALFIAREVGDNKSEGNALGSLGVTHHDLLGNIQKAIEYYYQQLTIARKIGNRISEGICLGNLGEALTDLENYKEAILHHQQAKNIAYELEDVYGLQYNIWGEARACLFQNDLVVAYAIIEAALQYDAPQNNHNASTLHGIIALRQGERETAQEAFTKSIAQADEILAKTPDYYSALDAKGLAVCGLAICDLRLKKDDLRSEAIETFRKAREIAPHAGVVKSVLRLFDELVKCDEEGVLKDVREVIAG